VVFPALHPEVGNVEIYEEGDGIRVHVGEITHGHFDWYDKSLTINQRNDEIIGVLSIFLRLCSLTRFCFGPQNSAQVAGVYSKSEDLKPFSEWKETQELIKAGLEMAKGEGRYFLWSGPVDIEG